MGLYEAKDYTDIVPHKVVEGSRSHVIHWDGNGVHCSEPKCEINHESETQQECPHWCDMLCDLEYSCPNVEPEADTAPADLNRQRCVNLEWRVQTLESQIDENAKRIEAILDLYSYLKNLLYSQTQEGE